MTHASDGQNAPESICEGSDIVGCQPAPKNALEAPEGRVGVRENGNLENLSPRELRENLTSQSALVRTLQQKIVNQRKQLKALQKAYDEQVQRGLSLADWF